MARVIKVNVSVGWAGGDYTEDVELPEGWDDMPKDAKVRHLSECSMGFFSEFADEFPDERCKVSAWVEDSDK